MNVINAAVIGCDMTEEFFKTSGTNSMEKFYWKKIMTSDTAGSISKQYPEAEIVNNLESIVHDENITLVLVAKNRLAHVRPVLDAGKSVRIV